MSILQIFALRTRSHRTHALLAKLAPRFLLFFTAGVMASTSMTFAGAVAYAADPDDPATLSAPVMELLGGQEQPVDLGPVNPTQAKTSLPWADNPADTSVSKPNLALPSTPSSTTLSSTTLGSTTQNPSTTAQADSTQPQIGGNADNPRPRASAQGPTMTAKQLPTTSSSMPKQPKQSAAGSASSRSAALPPALTPAATQPAATQPLATQPLVTQPSLYTVVPGDNIWRISEQVLTMRSGTKPSASQIAQYSATLIELNRSVLIFPQNPGLIVAGQVFELPQA
ncbi:MAG: hypothetical protein WD029_00040 [Microthrixaceae bacterium]